MTQHGFLFKPIVQITVIIVTIKSLNNTKSKVITLYEREITHTFVFVLQQQFFFCFIEIY